MAVPHISNLATRFPSVEALAVEWEEFHRFGEGTPVQRGTFAHSIRASTGGFAPILPCSNPGCQGGGFEILEVVESMLSDRLEEKAGLLVCIGWERTKSRQTEPSPCTQVIDYRIKVTYRKKSDSPRDSKGHHRDN